MLSIVFLYADNNNSKDLISQSKKSCEDGNFTSCFAIGMIPGNYEESKAYIKKGCDVAGIDMCLYMARVYYYGDKKSDTKKNVKLALKFFDVICDMGDGKVCMVAGMDYEKGNGVKKDLLIAKEFYELGCENGEKFGCLLVAKMYSEGKFIRQNHYKAKEYAGKACDKGSELGCKLYKEYNKYIPFDLPQL